MSDDLYIEGTRFVPVGRASADFDLHRDYISRLAREGSIRGTFVGRSWYIQEDSLKSYIIQRAYEREVRKLALSKQRSNEYKEAKRLSPTPQARTGVRSSVADTRGGFEPLYAREVGPVEIDGLSSTLQEKIAPASRSLHALLNAPTGLTHAAIQTTHASSLVTPAMEFFHKLIALTFAVSVTFGTYALLNPQSVRIANEALGESLLAFGQSVSRSGPIATQGSDVGLSQNASVSNAGDLAGISRFLRKIRISMNAVLNSVLHAISSGSKSTSGNLISPMYLYYDSGDTDSEQLVRQSRSE